MFFDRSNLIKPPQRNSSSAPRTITFFLFYWHVDGRLHSDIHMLTNFQRTTWSHSYFSWRVRPLTLCQTCQSWHKTWRCSENKCIYVHTVVLSVHLLRSAGHHPVTFEEHTCVCVRCKKACVLQHLHSAVWFITFSPPRHEKGWIWDTGHASSLLPSADVVLVQFLSECSYCILSSSSRAVHVL